MAKRKILVPVDGTDFSYLIFPVITGLFDGASSQVILLRVGDPVSGHVGAPPRVVTDDATFTSYEQQQDFETSAHPIYASQERDSAVADFRASTQPHVQILEQAGFELTYELRFGHPKDQILAYAKLHQIDLVAMVTHWRTGIDRLFNGNTLTSILPDLDVPVLVLRPEEVE